MVVPATHAAAGFARAGERSKTCSLKGGGLPMGDSNALLPWVALRVAEPRSATGPRLCESQQHPQRRTRRFGREAWWQAKLLRVTDPRAARAPPPDRGSVSRSNARSEERIGWVERPGCSPTCCGSQTRAPGQSGHDLGF
jgi:hypothetical protein